MSKLDWSNVDFETMIIHAGQGHDPAHGALATPIYQTSTFCFETVEEGADKFAKKIPGYQYTRGGNPTTRAFELKCAAMEKHLTTRADDNHAPPVYSVPKERNG